MKLLITGGCGFLGSNLASDAIKRGDSVFLFDNLSRKGSLENLQWLKSIGNFSFIQGDIRNFNDISSSVKLIQPDAIFHLAGQVAMTTSIINPILDFEVNVMGTLNLLESIRLNSPNSVTIYSSTNKVYGDLENFEYEEDKNRYICKQMPLGFDEDLPLNFHSPYGVSKGSADQYMLDYNRIYGIKTLVFRHSSMYGGRQYSTEDQGWVGWFCDRALLIKQKKISAEVTISGSGKQVRDLLHASDMKALYRNAVKTAQSNYGQVFNIGGGQKNSLSLLELLNFLEKKLSIRIKVKKNAQRISDQKIFIADIRKASKVFDWYPKVNYEEGISDYLTWIKLTQVNNIEM